MVAEQPLKVGVVPQHDGLQVRVVLQMQVRKLGVVVQVELRDVRVVQVQVSQGAAPQNVQAGQFVLADEHLQVVAVGHIQGGDPISAAVQRFEVAEGVDPGEVGDRVLTVLPVLPGQEVDVGDPPDVRHGHRPVSVVGDAAGHVVMAAGLVDQVIPEAFIGNGHHRAVAGGPAGFGQRFSVRSPVSFYVKTLVSGRDRISGGELRAEPLNRRPQLFHGGDIAHKNILLELQPGGWAGHS